MGNELKYIETKNGKYPLIYSLNVMEAIQNEYGSIDKWSNLIEPKDDSEPNLKALLFFFKEAINEGIDIQNETSTEKMDFVTSKKVGRIITEIGINGASEQLKSAVVSAVQNDNENQEVKNLTTTQN